MSDFYFNGTWASALGLTVKQMPQGGRGAQRFTSSTVPGRDSMIYRVENAYEDYDDQIVINCMGRSPRLVFNWLRGSGWAMMDNSNKRRWVRFTGEATIERWRPSDEINDIITVPMVCEPFSYAGSDELIQIASSQTVNGQGDWYARPLINIAGRGEATLTINDTSMLINLSSSNKNLHIDANAKTAYIIVNGVIQNATLGGITVTLMADDPDTRWGRLNYNGVNTISWTGSNVSSVSMHPRWRWF